MDAFMFEYPVGFMLLMLLPCLWLCPALKLAFYYSKPEWTRNDKTWFSREVFIQTAIITLLAVALASPILYQPLENFDRKGRDLVLCIDASGSMVESGFNTQRRQSKFQTVQEIVKAFIAKRFDDNIGLTLFGTFAYAPAPLTYDLPSLAGILDQTEAGIAGENTAVGEGIVQSLRTLAFGSAKKKVIVLLSDGFHNAGSISPRVAVEAAKKAGVIIYTIGIGREGAFDKQLLQTIAKESGGKYFQADDAAQLQDAYKQLDLLEPSPIRSDQIMDKKVLYPLFLVPVLFLILFQFFRETRV